MEFDRLLTLPYFKNLVQIKNQYCYQNHQYGYKFSPRQPPMTDLLIEVGHEEDTVGGGLAGHTQAGSSMAQGGSGGCHPGQRHTGELKA